jgi:toxin FitB
MVLLDTSVAVALCVEGHIGHRTVVDAIGSRRVGLAGHAWFETFSVLTRLPAPQRRASRDVLRLLRDNFPETVFVTDADQVAFTLELETTTISGGAIYDALVALAARSARRVLLTSDQRAAATYAALGVNVEFVA